MTLDDELRRRLQQAADRAGEGTDPGALTEAVTSAALAGTPPGQGRFRLFGILGLAGLVVGGVLGVTVLAPSDEAVAPRPTAGASTVDSTTGTAPSSDPATSAPAASSTSPSSTVPNGPSTSASTTAPSTVPPTAPPTAPPTLPPTAPPTAPPDNQQPTVQASTSVNEIYDASWSANCASTAAITAIATDNVGVTAVTGTWSGLTGSPKAFTKGAGNTWTMQFGPFSGLDANFNQLVAITVTARDAAGNTRTTVVNVRVWGTCLI